jgi:hypothetical protein
MSQDIKKDYSVPWQSQPRFIFGAAVARIDGSSCVDSRKDNGAKSEAKSAGGAGYGGFQKWRYPNSWMIYNGTYNFKMDDLGVPLV